MTSSQAHKALLKILPAFLNHPSFIKVAEFLYGPDWKTILKLDDNEAGANPAAEGITEETEGNGAVNPTPDNRLDPPSIQVFIQSLPIPDEGDDVARAAFNFVREYVLDDGNEEGQVHSSEAEAKDTVADKLTGSSRKAVLTLLGTQVAHRPYRKNNLPTKELYSWLQKPNSVRNFLFYKAQGLKDLMAARGIELVAAPKTIPNMIDSLAGASSVEVRRTTSGPENQLSMAQTGDELSPQDEATRAVLTKSFLPHRKGQTREHTSLGHRLEKPVLQGWIEIAEGIDSAVPGLQVCGAYSAGLAAKRDAIYAKDSIDFIINVKDPVEEGGGDIKTWGFEVKGRVTARTAAAERRNLQLLPEAHIRIADSEVFENVADQGERFQIMQHAFVYDLDTVVLAIGDNQSELIRSTIVDFSTEIKSHFGVVLEEIKKATLEWAYPELTRGPQIVQIPDRILTIAEAIKTINGNETLQGTANVWLALCKLPKPFPSMLRLIPGIYAFWNAVKGGSDTTTKLMDDSSNLRVPKCHLNTETAANARLLMLNLTLIHRLNQTFTAKEDINKYDSLYSYRHAANQRVSFHSSLLDCGDAFERAIKNIESEENARVGNENLPPTPQQQPLQRRRQPVRTQINGVVPQRIVFGACLSTKTPNKLKNSNANLSAEVKQMLSQCTGFPMKSYPTQRQRCAECGLKTSWHCVGCKRWLCTERRVTKDDGEGVSDIMKLYEDEVKGKTVNFQKVCFHRVHQGTWDSRASD